MVLILWDKQNQAQPNSYQLDFNKSNLHLMQINMKLNNFSHKICQISLILISNWENNNFNYIWNNWLEIKAQDQKFYLIKKCLLKIKLVQLIIFKVKQVCNKNKSNINRKK